MLLHPASVALGRLGRGVDRRGGKSQHHDGCCERDKSVHVGSPPVMLHDEIQQADSGTPKATFCLSCRHPSFQKPRTVPTALVSVPMPSGLPSRTSPS